MAGKRIATKVLTANRLRDGEVVYLTAGGTWSEHLGESHATDDPGQQEGLLEQGQRSLADNLIVEPYLIDVDETDGLLRPLSQREIIRAKGPTTHLNLGKQAAAAAESVG